MGLWGAAKHYVYLRLGLMLTSPLPPRNKSIQDLKATQTNVTQLKSKMRHRWTRRVQNSLKFTFFEKDPSNQQTLGYSTKN